MTSQQAVEFCRVSYRLGKLWSFGDSDQKKRAMEAQQALLAALGAGPLEQTDDKPSDALVLIRGERGRFKKVDAK